MIDSLIAGRLVGKPSQRTGQSGKPFVTAKVRVATPDGVALFASVITFDKTACKALAAMDDGDSVALSGALTPKVWTDRNGEARPAMDLVAHAVITAYHVSRKRKAITEPTTPKSTATPEFDDALPF